MIEFSCLSAWQWERKAEIHSFEESETKRHSPGKQARHGKSWRVGATVQRETESRETERITKK